jgi:hypothetical protein
VQGIKADPVDQLRSAGRIVTPAEYKIFLDAMQTKETRIGRVSWGDGLGPTPFGPSCQTLGLRAQAARNFLLTRGAGLDRRCLDHE